MKKMILKSYDHAGVMMVVGILKDGRIKLTNGQQEECYKTKFPQNFRSGELVDVYVRFSSDKTARLEKFNPNESKQLLSA